MNTCPGCAKNFEHTGYAHHLAQTINPSCAAQLQLSGLFPESSDNDSDGLAEDGDTDSLNGGDAEFTGDYFGYYDEQDLEWPDDNHDELPLESDGEDEEYHDTALEHGWERPADPVQQDINGGDDFENSDNSDTLSQSLPAKRQEAEAPLGHQPIVEKFPRRHAGAPVHHSRTTAFESYKNVLQGAENVWAPFVSRTDYEVAKWAKLRSSGSTAFSELLAIDGLREALGLSYQNSRELNQIIDRQLPCQRPRFKHEEIIVADEAFDVYSRDVMECVKALYSDPEFSPHLNYAPERHYADADKTIRMYHDIHTGKWWWSTQATWILLAYLPTSKLDHITNKAARRRTATNLFHACLRCILEPLKVPGEDGVAMASGDGAVHRGHPIVACYSADYPEQLLTTGVKSGECPKCDVPHKELGSPHFPVNLRDLNAILAALSLVDEDYDLWRRACQECGIKPVFKPFWLDLPHTNIFQSITPDVLHQLYQGIIKHLTEWIKEACSEAEIDARCRRLPPNHNIRLFLKGISHLSRVSGTEHNQICRFLLGIVIGIQLPGNLNSGRLTRAIRGILDFLYLAQYPSHTDQTLALLDDALTRFHDNKDIFLDLGIRSNFNLPKLHSFRHYVHMIKMYGTTDNYNTEYTERLHIDLTKDAYRATNHKDEYSQMTLWLERREKMLWHDNFVKWRLVGDLASQERPPPDMDYRRAIKMTKHPTVRRVPLDHIVQDYGATFFTAALARYVVGRNQPGLSAAQLEREAAHIILPFDAVATFHRIKFHAIDAHGFQDSSVTVDSVHSQPSRKDKRGHTIPARFDTVLVNEGDGGITGVNGYRVAQVRVVFTLTSQATNLLFPAGPLKPPAHLAYVEWFTPFQQPESHHGLYKICRLMRHGERLASIIDVSDIRRSVHLFPNFGAVVPREWTSSTVLELCPSFFVNSFSDRHAYLTIV
ncbi:uncharacterized protein F5891DRAFT_1144149 [Suillus fuscotomentosus]|uniref:C2H2-type domain-containing protein n=1 Tax=Suillus fuscotomentosus TaxID=1912939 RepID=A0AAD4EBP8_9AGAM|nr:uncharacterized protein F5891DRAFT_1144149 [Suillus fuscotomentosus]KAG1902029.1 hypothetical protein F5891DRAFT_1144149 [Suillus fuscotomentosus]